MNLKIKFFALSLVCLFATSLFSQSAMKLIISDVKIRQIGDVPVDENVAKEMVFLQKGMEFDALKAAVDVKTLLGTKRYTKVNSICEVPSSGMVSLVYEIEGRYRLMTSPVFNGIDHLSTRQAINASGIDKGFYVDQHIVNAAAIKVRSEYLSDGYRDCKVVGKIVKIKDKSEYVEVHFDVVEGKKTKVAKIQFNGNTVIKSGDLRRYSGQRSIWNPVGWFSKKRVSDFDLELVRSDALKQYHEIGYLDAKVSEPHKTQTNNVVYISFDVEEGQPYTVGKVDFDGMKLFNKGLVAAKLSLQNGVLASSKTIEEAKKFVKDSYSALGYIDTAVDIVPIPDESSQAPVMNFLIIVEESEKTMLNNIVIRGNTRTLDKVIRRELLLAPGDVFSGVELDRSIRRLKNLGYFSDVSYTTLNAEEPNTKDLILELEERSTGSVMLGFGYSSVDHLVGFFEISESNFDLFNWDNFRGAGQKARLSVSASSDNTDVEASFTEPWLFNKRLSLNVEGYYRTREYNEYDQTRGGGTIGLSRHIPWVGRVGLSYNVEQVKLDDVLEGEFVFADDKNKTFTYTGDEDHKYWLGSLKLTWTYDTRNNSMIPTSGTRAVASGKLYNKSLGSDYDMYELDFNIRNYRTLPWGHVLGLYAHAKVIDTYGDSDYVPIGNRYFLGGGRETRGFEYRDVGPKLLPANGDGIHRPYGGQTFFSASAEYNIPLTSMIRLAGFYDIGNVWKDPFEFDFSEFAHSIGIGLRLDVPGFPVRLDYAYSLGEDDDYTRKDAFVFWMGFDN